MDTVVLVYAIFTTLIVVQAAIWAVAAESRADRRRMVLLALAGFVWPVLLVACGWAVVSYARGEVVR